MRLLKIGRDQSNDIVIYSDKVSSLHAELTLLDSGDIMLEDKGSRNGTFVANSPIQPGKSVKIRRGDIVRFADAELQWNQVPMPEDNSAYNGVWGVGTNMQNYFRITGNTVSRFHATIKRGRDGKFYIFDHSKNGTKVNDVKITPNTPYRIKKNSAVVCGGVPLDLSRLPWPSEWWKYAVGIAACVLVLCGAGFGMYKAGIFGGHGCLTTCNAEDINDQYNSSTVMLIGMYHFEVECGDLDPSVLNKIGIPTKFYFVNDGEKNQLQPCAQDITASDINGASYYSASGFFISEDGKILTNLHVVKPWLFDGTMDKVESYCKQLLAKYSEYKTGTILVGSGISGISAYISQLKVKGVSDGIMLVPQGAYWSKENAIMCHAVSAGDDPNVDVALIQSDKQELPNKHCTFVDATNSIDDSADALKVGKKMFTIGFPHGLDLQSNSKEGIQALCNSGEIVQNSNDYTFTFSANSYHGASGSPIFNEHGMLIGILSSGIEKESINTGVKAQYITKLLNSPFKVEDEK